MLAVPTLFLDATIKECLGLSVRIYRLKLVD